MRNETMDRLAEPLWSEPRQPDGRLRPDVRARLIELYGPLATGIAAGKSARNFHIDGDDFRQQAYLGLIQAVDAYDPHNARCARFTTFATWRVFGETTQAERGADPWPEKQRRRHNNGELVLPAVQAFDDGTDVPVDQAEDRPEDVLGAMLSRTDPVVAGLAADMTAADMDVDAMAERWGTSDALAGWIHRFTIEELRGVPVMV